ncbi:hypothetical protein OH738_30975 [Streptomyces hirsutus]|uniref:hypothetical protein n=1 Tax=Streptomyces hirsutus TaxID=35620 RepID=UPI0038671F6F|nr:hypothetical protein OH738_30975 [Streptomyces hirsutus]
MSIWYRLTALIRSHWRRVCLPAGFVLFIWGNKLINASYRTAGMVLLALGLGVALYGLRFWKRGFADDWRVTKRVRRWADSKRSDPQWIRAWGDLRVVVWGIVMAVIVWRALGLVDKITWEVDRVLAGPAPVSVLLGIWMLLPWGARRIEPKDSPLDRLWGRMWRAAVSRAVANTIGIYYAGWVIYAVVFSTRPALLVPAAVTLGGAMVVSWHKTWARLRKLSTQVYGNVQTLERDLKEIRDSEEAKTREKQDAARRSWDAVQLDLQTSVDTGYAFGTPLLPRETRDDLHKKVEKAIEALKDDKDAAKDVLVDLHDIQAACVGRIDSVA